MSNANSVHQCLFCTQTFKSSAAKDEHILEHFARETCNDCHQDLIRIGGNLYVLHGGATCIREYDYDSENYYDDVSSKLATVLVEGTYVKGEPNDQPTDEDEEDHLQDDNALELELGEWMKAEPNADDCENSENTSQEGEEEAATNESMAESTMDEDSINDENNSQEAITLSKSIKINIKMEMDANANDSTDTNGKRKSTKKEENKKECEFCGEFFHRYALYRHKRDVHNPTICVCQICHTQFKSEEYLQRHMRYKHGASANVFKCDKCHASFRKEDLFRIHQCNAIQTSDDGQNKCEKCGKEFSRKQTLLKHQVLVHSKMETIHCKACARVFSDVEERDAHQFECSAKKNLQLTKYYTTCEICGKVLSRRGALQRHMASQHQ